MGLRLRLRVRVLAVVLGVCVPVGGVALGSPATALAAFQHPFLSQLTGFGNPNAVTVGPSGDLYVADSAGGVVDRLSSSGAPSSFSASKPYVEGSRLTGTPSGGFTALRGVAVNNTSGDIYVSDGVVVDVFASTGEYLSQLTETPVSGPFKGLYGLAVDQSTGELYVSDALDGVVDVFSSSGEYVSQFGRGVLSNRSAESIAVNDLTGTVYVGDSLPDAALLFDSLGNPVPPAWHGGLTPSGSFGGGYVYVGLDQSSGHVYVATTQGVVNEFQSSSTEEYSGQLTGTPGGPFSRPQAVAVDPVSGHVYVADGAGVVDVFGPAVVVPDVSTSAASGLTRTTATFNGAVNPDETSVTGCEFEYRSEAEPTYAQAVPCAQALPLTGSAAVPVSAEVTGLSTNTVYHYRLVASNVSGANHASDQTLTTPLAVDALSTGPAEAVTPSAATLTGSLSPDGTDAHYYFEFGPDTSYGSTSPAAPGTDAGTVAASVHAETALTGLNANATYHYRLVGVNSFGTSYGEDATFTTSGPPAVNSESSEVIGLAATLSAQINPDGFETQYHFEYGPDTSYGTSAPIPDASIAAGFAEAGVSVEVAGLALGRTYHFRVVATNADSPTPIDGPDQTFTTHGLPTINSEAVSDVLSTSTTLEARINPAGEDTHYYFQYGTSSCSGTPSSCTSVPSPPGTDIGSAESVQTASAALRGLTPGTIYHYRVLAASALGAAEGSDRTFTTPTADGQLPGSGQTQSCPNEQLRAEQPYGTRLPDCRAYEMVSPLDKNHHNIAESLVRASASGEAVTYQSYGSFAEATASQLDSRYVTRRGPTGWSTRNITYPYHPYETVSLVPFGELVFTPDLSKGLAQSRNTALTSGSPDGYVNLYVADTEHGAYQPVTGPPPGMGTYRQEGPTEPRLGGASTDLSHVVFEEADPEGLTPGATPNQIHLYESADGKLTQIDIAPEGTAFTEDDVIGASTAFTGPSDGDVWHAVSNDGSRVFFTAGEPGQQEIGQVYVREVNEARTIEVSASQRVPADPNGATPARYWGASADGSRVFFTSRSELTNDANTGTGDSASNLYEYDVETGALRDLTVDTNAADVRGAAVLGVVTASEDGSYAYFVAEGELAPGATSGQPNLYLTRGGQTTFIATLSPATSKDENEVEAGGDSRDWGGARPARNGRAFQSLGPGTHSVRVTSDGKHLAFESVDSLTGYGNEPAEPGACENNHCREVYLYDATGNALTCASCDPSGDRPTGEAELGGASEGGVEAGLSGRGSSYYLQRNLSDDGTLFFESPDPLVPHDSNGRRDVYEYEGGHLYPISDVAGNYNSYFLDASPSGSDVFIATADRLVASDTDAFVDVYDVRVGGGYPVAVSPPPCQNGDSCKGPVSAQPGVFGAPASATFSGAGNVVPDVSGKPTAKSKAKPKRCKKGYAKKRGRCTRAKSKKSSKHSKKGRK